MLACGIGCRRDAPASEIETVIGQAYAALGLVEGISVLATEASKAAEPGVREAAARLGAELLAFSSAELSGVCGQVLTISQVALLHKGTPSVAEAAALLAAGANARLLGPRLAGPTTTCAFAVGEGRLP